MLIVRGLVFDFHDCRLFKVLILVGWFCGLTFIVFGVVFEVCYEALLRLLDLMICRWVDVSLFYWIAALVLCCL